MKTLKPHPRPLVAWLAAVVILFGTFLIPVGAAETPVNITIIHTNDVHARVDVEPYVAGLAKEKRDAGENVLVFSAGDVLHGQPLATLPRGKSIVEIMNAVGYDAMSPGNHDFGYGSGRLKRLSEQMDFPVLAANVTNAVGGKKVFDSYMIREMDGVKVGIFGLATPETASKTNPKNVSSIAFGFPPAVARTMVAKLEQEGCDVIIALAHLGVDEETWSEERSTALAKIKGIDLIIDGHSHTAWQDGNLVGNTLLAQTGSHGENIGVVELAVSGGRVTSRKASLIPVMINDEPNPALSSDSAVADLIGELRKSNDQITAQVVGATPVALQGEREFVRTQETNLGNLVADSMRWVSGADIALTNGGGIRASLPAGEITKGDVLTVLPFGNFVITKEMRGSDIIAALELGLAAYPEPAGGFPQVSGVRFSFDPKERPGSRITEISLADGTPLEPDKTYTLATNDFMAEGGDDYTMIGSAPGKMAYSAMDEALIDYLQTAPFVSTGADGRIVAIGTAQKAA